jgi:ABC-type glycerol-3-phosphate transport system substrate-binding protein
VRPLAACLLLAACAGAAPSGAGGGEPAAAAEALSRFAAAVRSGRLDEAWPLLSARWRARTTPATLAADLEAAGNVGRGAAERVQAALAAGERPAVDGNRASLAVGEGKAALLLREGGAWRVEALE